LDLNAIDASQTSGSMLWHSTTSLGLEDVTSNHQPIQINSTLINNQDFLIAARVNGRYEDVVVCEDIKEIIEENYSNTYTPNY
jgi:hypothetical protein